MILGRTYSINHYIYMNLHECQIKFAWIVASSSLDLPTQWTGKSIDMSLSCLYTFLAECCCLLRRAKLPAVPLSHSTVHPIYVHNYWWCRTPKGSVPAQRAEGMRIIRSKTVAVRGGLVAGGWGKCRSEVLHNLYYFQRIVGIIIARMMRWAENVTRIDVLVNFPNALACSDNHLQEKVTSK